MMERNIKHTFFLPHPVETVWEYLTNAELLAQWLMKSDFKPIVGHKFQFKTKPKIKLGFDGNVYCEVVEMVPFKKLSYTWKGGASKENMSLDLLVIWTLESKDDGTILVLEHKGFKGMKNYFSYLVMNLGWKKIGKRMWHLIDNEKNEATNA